MNKGGTAVLRPFWRGAFFVPDLTFINDTQLNYVFCETQNHCTDYNVSHLFTINRKEETNGKRTGKNLRPQKH